MNERRALHALTATTRIELVKEPPRSGEVWPLLDPYIELVWVEVLGVTATAIARRLGHLLADPQPVRGLSLDAVAAPLSVSPGKVRGLSLDAVAEPLSVSPGKVLDGLRRLHHHGLIQFRESAAVIGCSGLAPAVPARRLASLSPYTNRLRLELEQRRLAAQRSPAGRPVSNARTLAGDI